MTGRHAAPEVVAAAVLALALLAALLSGLRLTLARASRARAGTRPDEAGAPPPIRARVLGGLLVAGIVANVAAAAIGSELAFRLRGERGLPYAIVAISAAVVLSEAAARLAATRGWLAGALRLAGIRIDRYAEKLSASEEIRGQVDQLHRRGDVVKAERDMLGGLLDLKDLSVAEIMVHRTKMVTVGADLPADALIREVLASPHTRLPLWRERPDNVVGVLHARDLFRAAMSGERVDPEALATPPWFVPDTTSLRDQLSAFLARKQHFALVVDEYGDLMGLVTLEDILEEIVGDIADEHDVAARGIRTLADGSLLLDGTVALRDLNRMMDWALPDEEATTVAGLVIHEAQAIPEAGQVFTFHGFRFEVLRRVRNRLTALKVTRTQPAAADGPPRPLS